MASDDRRARPVCGLEVEAKDVASVGMLGKPAPHGCVRKQQTELPCRRREIDVVESQCAAGTTGEREGDTDRAATFGYVERRKLVSAEIETAALERPVSNAERRMLLVARLEHRRRGRVDRARLERMS